MKIVVLILVQQSQYGTSVFIIPNKEGTVRFITYYFRLNQKLVRNPYPSPRIGETMYKMEILQYATELGLNMGYYTISLNPTSQDMTTTVTEYGKFRYNRPPMGRCDSGDISQSKVDNLLGDTKGVKNLYLVGHSIRFWFYYFRSYIIQVAFQASLSYPLIYFVT